MIPKAPSLSSEKRWHPPYANSIRTMSTSSRDREGVSFRKKPRGATILVLLLVFGSLSLVFRPYPPLPSVETTELTTQLDAIVTIAMCGFPATEFVQALRNAGQWRGPIYVLTDDPAQEDSSLATILDVRHHHPSFATEQEFQDYKSGILQYPTLWPKWHKTQLLELLPAEMTTILFVDDDMLARKRLSEHWLPSIAPLLANPDCELVINPERWYTTWPLIGGCKDAKLCGKYGGGMWIQKRVETSKLMKEWGDTLIRPPFVTQRDQGKLTLAVESTSTRVCYFPSHWNHIQNGADLIDRYFFKMVWWDATWFHYASSKGSSVQWKDIQRGVCDLSSLTDGSLGNTHVDAVDSSLSSSQRPATLL
jgi:hypothetical protein